MLYRAILNGLLVLVVTGAAGFEGERPEFFRHPADQRFTKETLEQLLDDRKYQVLKQRLQHLSKDQRRRLGHDYYYLLARAQHNTYQLQNAIQSYKKFLRQAPTDDKRSSTAHWAVQRCQHGQQLMQDSVNVTITPIKSGINTAYAEYVPVMTADQKKLLFTSRRPEKEGNSKEKQIFEDIYISHKHEGQWSNPEPVPALNTEGHDATISLSPSGQRLFIYRSDAVKWGNILVSYQTVNGWSAPEKLPAPVNSKYWEGSASITDDGLHLYFASNRPGGYGGKDLYVSHLQEPGRWGEPQNLGSKVNTKHDEDAPSIHPGGILCTLVRRGITVWDRKIFS